MSIKNSIKNILRYGFRDILRDNLLLEKKLNKIRKNIQLSPDKLKILTCKLLVRSLKHAIKNIPYYFNCLIADDCYKEPENILANFPIISKNDLLSKRELFYPAGGKQKCWWSIGKTSGTTGTPLEVFRDFSSILYERAFIRRHWECAGFKKLKKRATVRGDLIVPLDKPKPPFWFFNCFDNQLLISSRHLKHNYFNDIVKKLEEFSPYILEAYPSTAFELAVYLKKKNVFIKIPYVFTGSEMLYEYQRDLIAERFCCKIMDFYGMAERVAFASECEYGNMHINTDYSYVEILDKNGEPTDDYGYITGTTYYNLAMPLVRYQMNDMTKWKKGKCQCSRPFPMIEPVRGKFEDTLYGGNGTPISPSILTFAFKGLHSILKSQVAQIDKNTWEVRIVVDSNFCETVNDKLKNNIRQMVDPDIDIIVKIVDDIPRTSAGKYRWVLNEWKNG